MQKRPFRKDYLGDWSPEIFVIKSRLPTVPVTYQLVDLVGEPIKGKFYEQELQKVSTSDDEHFHIDRILKTKKRANVLWTCTEVWVSCTSTVISQNTCWWVTRKLLFSV